MFFLVPKHRNNHDLGISRLGKRFLIKLKTIGEWSRFCLWEEIKTKAHRSSGSDSILCDGIPYILHSFIYSSSSSLLGFFLKRYRYSFVFFLRVCVSIPYNPTRPIMKILLIIYANNLATPPFPGLRSVSCSVKRPWLLTGPTKRQATKATKVGIPLHSPW